jgi:hypothetical protein
MKRVEGIGSLLKLQGSSPFVIVAVAGLLLLGSAAVPIGRQRKAAPDPTARARQAYQTLEEQIGGSEVALDAADSAGAAVDAGAAPRQRSRFQPVWRAPVPGAPGSAPVAAGGPPTLTGIFIDGVTREAILNGRRVRVGDRVAGYQVSEIAPDGVRVERGKTTVRLQRGEKP